MPSPRDRLVRAIYRLGWWGAGRLPQPVIDAVITGGARIAVRHDGRHVETLRRNLSIVTAGPVDDDLLRAAMRSYLRTFSEVLALPRWSRQRMQTDVRIIGERPLRDAMRDRGAVVALPHSANWDLAGAWASSVGMPVTTVAEQLDDPEFAAFVAFRNTLGIEVLSHRDARSIPRLIDAVGEGRVVCLIADRDLVGGGVAVHWAGHPITMPAGPALVARRTGAALIPAVCWYEPAGMVITIGDVIDAQPGRAGLISMTQQVADFFAARIAEHPTDWHMLQPFFGRTRLPIGERG